MRVGMSYEIQKGKRHKTTDLAVHAFQFHPHEALPRHAPHAIIHPRRPQPRTARNLPRQMRTHRGPRAAITVQSQDARKTLQMVMYESVIKLLGGVFGRRRHDAVSREESKFAPGGGA